VDGLIEPNLHPVFVHFAFALVVTSAAAYLLALALPRRRETLRMAADWMLGFGALAILATVAAGFQAYYSVAHDAPSHEAMRTHRNWAVPTALFVLVLAAWRWRERAKPASALFSALVTVAAVLMTTTAWWGGRLVFGYGLGVASLPRAEGEGHDHGGAAAHARGGAETQSASAAPGTPEAAVEAFGAALRAGDEAAVRRLVVADVVIAEGGGVERSFEEYRGHHMPADMAFTQAVAFTLEQRDVVRSGDQATVISHSRAEGAFRGQEVHSRMMETMVLVRDGDAWRIKHIHWSSAPISGEHEH
jgi:uncharacterized membrane protein/ketosteroid isomerase-like protein